MTGEPREYVSRREFGELEERVHAMDKQLALLSQRYESLPGWLITGVSVGLGLLGTMTTLLLAGRL